MFFNLHIKIHIRFLSIKLLVAVLFFCKTKSDTGLKYFKFFLSLFNSISLSNAYFKYINDKNGKWVVHYFYRVINWGYCLLQIFFYTG